MSVEAKQDLVGFAPGQLWKTETGYILITDQGRRLVSYKKLREPRQRAAVTNLIRPEALISYLADMQAELVPFQALSSP